MSKALTANLQQQLNEMYDSYGKVTDDDVYMLLYHHFNDIPSDIDIIELKNPCKNVNGQILIEFTESFFEHKLCSDQSQDIDANEEEEGFDYPSDEEEDYFIIHRIYDSTEDEDNDNCDED